MRKTSGELARTRTWSRDDDKWFGGLDVGIGAVAFVGNNRINIGRITFGERVKIGFDFVVFEFVGEIFGFFLTIEKCDYDRTDIELFGTKKFDEADNFGFIGNHMVGTNFGFFDGIGVDAKNDFGVVFEFLKKSDFEIGEKARKSASGVLVVDEFAAKFDI